MAEFDPSCSADERTTLSVFLDDQRQILAWKCSGLSEAQLKQAAVPPSALTLLGLVRHMAEVERAWFRRYLQGEPIGKLWDPAGGRGSGFEQVAEADVAEAFAAWESECEQSRAILRDLDSLDRTFSTDQDPVISARCMLNHMIEEYSRHNGHADLLRERLDGQTGAAPPPSEP